MASDNVLIKLVSLYSGYDCSLQVLTIGLVCAAHALFICVYFYALNLFYVFPLFMFAG